MKLKTVFKNLKDFFRPMTAEEKKEAGIVSAHTYREAQRLKETGE